MTETSDAELLAAWVTQRREPAFHALVVRYAGLVHMASKRACGDESLAADASQLVFIQLAQKAKSLLGHPPLAGWLHVTAVMKTRELLGKNQRVYRKLNRFHSAMEPESSTPHDGVWQEIQPHLNDTLDSLSKNDRKTIRLRFYRSLSSKAIAASAASTTGIVTIALLIMTKKITIAAATFLLLTGGTAVAFKLPSLFSKPASASGEKRPSEGEAKLIAKYGESRVKMARQALATTLEINDTMISLISETYSLMPKADLTSDMLTDELAPLLEKLKLNPEQLAGLQKLYKAAFQRQLAEMPKEIRFIRENGTAASELLLAADGVSKGKISPHEYQRLRDSSPALVKATNELFFVNVDTGFPLWGLSDPVFVKEFTKQLDASQAPLVGPFVKTEIAKYATERMNAAKLSLEEIDEGNHEIKNVFVPLKLAIGACKVLVKFKKVGKK